MFVCTEEFLVSVADGDLATSPCVTEHGMAIVSEAEPTTPYVASIGVARTAKAQAVEIQVRNTESWGDALAPPSGYCEHCSSSTGFSS